MSHRKDDPEEMERMSAWLAAACQNLGVERTVLDTFQDELLALIGTVAHGPSRPGAPLTAYLVGYAAGSQGKDPHQLIESLQGAARNWN